MLNASGRICRYYSTKIRKIRKFVENRKKNGKFSVLFWKDVEIFPADFVYKV